MKYKDILENYHKEEKKCFVNGMPEEEGGLITLVDEDYIVFSITNKDEDKPENNTEEHILIPISAIFSLSTGEKKTDTLSAKLNATSTINAKEEVKAEAVVKPSK